MVYQKCYWWRVLRKRLHLKEHQLSVVQVVGRWMVRTPLRVSVFVTLATQHLEYRCKAFFETPCITSGSHIKP
jgi:hypothetical protein